MSSPFRKLMQNSSFREGYNYAMAASNIAWQVANLRRTRNLTVQELADKAGVSIVKIYAIEAGNIEKIDVESLTKITMAMDIDYDAKFSTKTSVVDTSTLYVPGFDETVAILEKAKRELEQEQKEMETGSGKLTLPSNQEVSIPFFALYDLFRIILTEPDFRLRELKVTRNLPITEESPNPLAVVEQAIVRFIEEQQKTAAEEVQNQTQLNLEL